jgi:hypothetical protein
MDKITTDMSTLMDEGNLWTATEFWIQKKKYQWNGFC